MEYDDFQEAVLELADGGVRLTKGSVALRLKIDPASAGTMLDRMTRDGHLELDLDERSGEIFYEVSRRRREAEGKGPLAEIGAALGKPLSGGALAAKVGTALVMAQAGVRPASRGGSGEMALPPEQRKQIAVGILLGGLFPGFGLAYAAPWTVVVGASIVVALGVKVIGLIPLLSSFLLIPFVALCAVASAVLGGLYTWQFNRTGKRTPLRDEPGSASQVLKLLRK